MEHIAALRHIQPVGLRSRFRALSTTPVNAETPPALEIAGQNTAAPAHAAELAQGFRELFAMEPVCPWDAAAASALVSYCAAPPLGRMSECAGERDPLARHPPCLPYAGVLVRFAKCGQCGRPVISSAPAGVRSLGLASSSPGIKWWSGSSCGGGWREPGCGLPGSPDIPVAPCLPSLPFASGRVRQVAAIRAHRIANPCRVCGGPDRSGNGDTRPRG